MNFTMRVGTGSRSFIIKQSRPWVEKYPDIPAPVERTIMEGRFYSLIRSNKKLAAYTPGILGIDEKSFVILMADLGGQGDLTTLYEKDNKISQIDLEKLVAFISELHQSFHVSQTAFRITNPEMRRLNYEHLFVFPFKEKNNFDLNTVQPGLQAVSLLYKRDERLKRKAVELGAVYLSDGDILLHGDFYPGSWLNTSEGVKVIDPEFCFFGPPEFDLAVFIAHMKMAQQSSETVQWILNNYKGINNLNRQLLSGFAGIEVMRRIIGLAQLPLSLTLEEKEQLLKEAYGLIIGEQSL